MGLIPREGPRHISDKSVQQLQRVLSGWFVGFRRLHFQPAVHELYEGILQLIHQFSSSTPITGTAPVRLGWTRLLSPSDYSKLEEAEQEVIACQHDFSISHCTSCRSRYDRAKSVWMSLQVDLKNSCLQQIVKEQCGIIGDRLRCWKLLSNLRNPHKPVPISPSVLLEHFATVYSASDEPLIPVLHAEDFLIGPQLELDFNDGAVFSLTELDVALKELNVNAAVGPDGISAKLILRIFSEDSNCRVVLLHLMNDAFLSGVTPHDWCKSDISVLFKGKGSCQNADNYRGICVLNSFFKVYERLVYHRVLAWAERHNFFGSDQYGFRAGRSGIDAIFVVKEYVEHCCMGKGKPVYLIFVDLQKAFPSVLRSKLISRLLGLGLHPRLVRAIASMLSLNSARLKFGDLLSAVFLIVKGVREGGALSPPLFALVFSIIWELLDFQIIGLDGFDLGDSRNAVFAVAYADDLVIGGTSAFHVMEKLREVKVVLATFGMVVNVTKTQAMVLYAGRGREPIFAPTLDGASIKVVDRFCHLGFWFDRNLTGNVHRACMATRAKVSVCSIAKLLRELHCCKASMLRTFFLAFCSSQFYGYELLPVIMGSDMDDVLPLFVRMCLALPNCVPLSFLYVFLNVRCGQSVVLRLKAGIIRRCISYQYRCSFTNILFASRSHGLRLGVGFFADLLEFLSDYSGHDALEISMPSDIPLIADRVDYSFRNEHWGRIRSLPSLRFFSDIFPQDETPELFWHEPERYGFEMFRLFFLFLSGTIRWTIFVTPRRKCIYCNESLHVKHFLECPLVQSELVAANVSYDILVSVGQAQQWKEFFGLICHVLFIWSECCSSVLLCYKEIFRKAMMVKNGS